MSTDALAWALNSRGHSSASEKLLLITLADYADPDQFLCWPTIETLADVCAVSISNLVESLEILESRGFLTCLKRGAPAKPWLFRLHAETPATPSLKLPLFPLS